MLEISRFYILVGVDFYLDAAVLSAATEVVSDGVAGVLIDLGAGDSVFLQGTSLIDLDRADFIL